MISDFYADNFSDALKIANRKHDLVALRVMDKTEMNFPNIGLVKMKDNETGKIMWVNSGSANFRNQYHKNAVVFEKKLKDTFHRAGVDFAVIDSVQGYIKPLINLFKSREAR